MDGCREHHSTPFKGDRWSLVFFVHSSVHRLSVDQRARLERLGFRLPLPGVSPEWPRPPPVAGSLPAAGSVGGDRRDLPLSEKGSRSRSRERRGERKVKEIGAGPELPPPEDPLLGTILEGQEVDSICIARPALYRPERPRAAKRTIVEFCCGKDSRLGQPRLATARLVYPRSLRRPCGQW